MAQPSLRVITLPSTRARIDAALAALPPDGPLVIIGGTRAAADDAARRRAAERTATAGVSRFSLLQFAARHALIHLARRGRAPSTSAVSDAVAARAIDALRQADALQYFAPVAATPGFPVALSKTVAELRQVAIHAGALAAVPRVGADLHALLTHFERALEQAGVSDRADLFRTASEALRARRLDGAVLLLDVPCEDPSSRTLLETIVACADCVVATVAPGDDASLFEAGHVLTGAPGDEAPTDLSCARRYLFASSGPDPRGQDGSLECFSAPGEGRECVEIARRIQREARRGVRFDDMAVLVRTPAAYVGLLEHAFRRAGIPAWFDQGTRRPDPAGRAFLALLACGAERLSAARFAEYLSLAQVPEPGDSGPDAWDLPSDETSWRRPERQTDEREQETALVSPAPVDEGAAVVAGSLRAPWRWEVLIADARVVGGGVERWQRRLAGFRAELTRRHHEALREEGEEGASVRRLQSTLVQLGHLETFALPVVSELASWQGTASWSEWLDRLTSLVPRVLRRPGRVLAILRELRPLAGVGPVSLDDVRRVLAQRLLTIDAEPPSRRYGRVFVGTPTQARGRAFRVVFVPGLAERLFPQKPREDPLLLDAFRRTLGSQLATEGDRVHRERQLLRLAVDAATERLCVSYPRLDVNEARTRVPSFYVLDLVRASTGVVPHHEALEAMARQAGDALLAWPAPADPSEAIDEVEHDLAVVRRLLDAPDRESVRGHAHYLLGINPALRRSVRARWRQATPTWSSSDGMLPVTVNTATSLATHRLTHRPYSVSALQRYATCPYQFWLSAIMRLQPFAVPEPLERLDPLTRGSLVHDVQARFLRDRRDQGQLPLDTQEQEWLHAELDRVLDQVAGEAHDALAPAIERVWRDDVAAIRRDVHGWLRLMVAESDVWRPAYFEWGFGRVPGPRDPASRDEPVALPEGYVLRGAIDLIETHVDTGEVRVTDYKTGKAPARTGVTVIGGGRVLQPVLYARVVGQALGMPVRESRLLYCTTVGRFTTDTIPVTESTTRAGMEALEVIDRAVETGAFPAAPIEHACDWCDVRAVCGPAATRRAQMKASAPLADLMALRSRA